VQWLGDSGVGLDWIEDSLPIHSYLEHRKRASSNAGTVIHFDRLYIVHLADQ